MLLLADGTSGSLPPHQDPSPLPPCCELPRGCVRIRLASGFALCWSRLSNHLTPAAPSPLCPAGAAAASQPPAGGGRVSWLAPDLGLGVCTASLHPPARLLVWRHPCLGLVPLLGPGGSLHSPHGRFVASRPAEVGSVPPGRLRSGMRAAGAGSLGTECRTSPWAQPPPQSPPSPPVFLHAPLWGCVLLSALHSGLWRGFL